MMRQSLKILTAAALLALRLTGASAQYGQVLRGQAPSPVSAVPGFSPAGDGGANQVESGGLGGVSDFGLLNTGPQSPPAPVLGAQRSPMSDLPLSPAEKRDGLARFSDAPEARAPAGSENPSEDERSIGKRLGNDAQEVVGLTEEIGSASAAGSWELGGKIQDIVEGKGKTRLARVTAALPASPSGGLRPALQGEGRLPDDHPAVRSIAQNLRALTDPKDRRRLDPKRLQAFIHKANDRLPGAFQAYPYNGRIWLVYVENGQAYHLDEDLRGGVKLSGRRPPSFKPDGPGDSPQEMRKRFKRPKGMFLVGFERGFDGAIIPLFSESKDLTEFRDMSMQEGEGGGFLGFLFSPANHAALPRTAMEVPLAPIKMVGRPRLDAQVFQSLPQDIRRPISAGYTLTTARSLDYISYDVYQGLRSSQYSALVIANDQGQGRTGVVLKDGVPLLVNMDGREYFLEIKGIGLATERPIGDILHSRTGEGLIRLGRTDEERVEREFEGYRVVHSRFPEDKDMPRPVVGVTLPEFAASSRIYSGKRKRDEELSGQVWRLAASTRRMAYSDNPAFGMRYSRRPRLLRKARELYGEILARLRLTSPSLAYMHNSPHPQNFVYFPLEDKLLVTDYSDIAKIESSSYLRMELPDIDQYLAFKGKRSRADLLRGMRKVLEPLGFWAGDLRRFEKRNFSDQQFVEALVSDYLVRFVLEAGNLAFIRKFLIPSAPDPETRREFIQEVRDAVEDREYYLEMSFRLYLSEFSGLKSVVEDIQRIARSKTVPARFIEFKRKSAGALRRLRRLIQEVDRFYRSEEKRGESAWKKKLSFYARKMLDFKTREAAIYASMALPSGQAAAIREIR